MFKRVDTNVQEPEVKEEMKSEMKEIVYDAAKHMVVGKNFSMRDTLDGLMGKLKDEVVDSLKKLVADNQITEYRVAPIGSVVTQDYKPSRISVFIDADGKVIDAQQG
jgi:hypothetical protein